MRIRVLTILLLAAFSSYAQTEKQTDTTINTRYKPLISVDRVKLLQNVDVIANMQYGLNNNFREGEYTGSSFRMNQFRLEIKGKVHDKVYFRFRNRFTRSPDPQSVDNISRATDLAFIRVDATPKWSFSFGKLCADWGGYEFDLNPIDIYEYNDIVEFADNFLSGAQASFRMNKNHEFTGQILNSRTKTFDELYGTIPGIEESKFPLAAVVNWRGTLAGGKFTTLWSYSSFLEAKQKKMHYLALGNQLHLNKQFTITYDFKWSDEDLDRKTIVSDIIPDSYYPYAAQDVRYIEHWLWLQYRFHAKWNLSLIGMVSDAYWDSNPAADADNHLRTSYGVIPTIEFYPFKNLNLRFFTTYVGRMYKFSDYAKQSFNSQNYNTGRISIGFVSPLTVL